MRYDTPVYFQTIKQGEYNADTGNYGESTISEEMRLASVTSTGQETLNLLYGEIKQGVFTVRLQNRYHKPFNRIRIGNMVYRVDMNRPLRFKHIFIVSEVPNNGTA